jgi:ATP-binding cassette subfamily C protein
VSQDTYLFHDSVRANLLWANPGASDADIRTALAQAAAAEFVDQLPQGLDTVVGDRGVLLSGGERQRLSLARALLRKPRVLISMRPPARSTPRTNVGFNRPLTICTNRSPSS